jgi:hypothetical protein
LSRVDSGAGSNRRRALVLLVAMLAVVLAAEVSVRALSPFLAEPLLYGDETTQVKVAQLDRLSASCVDLVFAGDSMGRDAFDPHAFTATDPAHRSAYNASLDGASPALLRRWLGEEVVPRLHPSTVVIALSSLDVNAHGNAARSAVAAYDGAPLTAAGLEGRVSSWFLQHSTLVRYRTELRDPQAVSDAVSRWRDGVEVPRRSADGVKGLIGSGGEGLSRRSLHYRHDAATKSFTRDQLLAGFAVDDGQVREARDLIGDLRAGGTTVALLILPVTTDYIALHPNGQADFDEFLADARSMADGAGVPLIDLHASQTDESRFADTHHLNGEGQAWLSTTLPEHLQAAGVPAARRCG